MANYDLIIEWTGETFLVYYGFTASLADEFVLGASKCTVWQLDCELTSEQVRRIVSDALRKL